MATIGAFSLLPPIPADCEDVSQHVYTMVKFRGAEFPIKCDTTIRGNCIVDASGSHWEACLTSPVCPWMRIPLHRMLVEAVMLSTVKPMELAPQSAVAVKDGNVSSEAEVSPCAASRVEEGSGERPASSVVLESCVASTPRKSDASPRQGPPKSSLRSKYGIVSLPEIAPPSAGPQRTVGASIG